MRDALKFSGDFIRFPTDADFDEPRFLLADAAAVAGISTNLLKSWLSRKPIVIALGPHDREPIGKGSSRVFTLRRILTIALTAEMTRLGITPSHAGLLASSFTDMAWPGESWETRQNKILVAYPSSNTISLVDGDFCFDAALQKQPGMADHEENPNSFIAVNFKSLKTSVIKKLMARGKIP